jgi:hypothetical protein
MNRSIPAALLAVAGILGGCIFETRMASTEILDPPGKSVVTGIVLDSSGFPASGALVRAFPVDFDPVSDPRRDSIARFRDTTDALGAFGIKGLDTGACNLFIERPADGTRLLIRGVRLTRGTTAVSGDHRLKAPGALRLTVPDSLRHDYAYLYLPGTPIYSYVDISGETAPTLLDSVPAGEAPGIAYAAENREGPGLTLSSPVQVQPGDTVPVDAFAAWIHMRRIFVVTSGLGLTGSVSDFPLLIRLDASNFRFSEARTDGRDLRFADPDGAPLAYEIESWDAAAQRAAVWVRMDTVRAASDARFIRMYWGNASPALADASDGAAVFRAEAGYRGVWHLSQGGGDGLGNYRDATAQGNHGTGSGFTVASRVATPSGHGQTFRGPDTRIQAGTSPSLHSDTGLTLEAWVRIDAYREYANFISKAFTSNTKPTYEYGLSLGNELNNFRFALIADTSYRDLFSAHTVRLGKWYQVVATYDGRKMRLFLDGAPADSLDLAGGLRDFGRTLMMGQYEHVSTYSLVGAMDEVRMSRIPRPADYVRLSWEAQRQDSRLLRFE